MEPISLGTMLAISAATAGASAGISAAQASKQNRAIQASMDAQARAAALQQRQLANATGLEQKKEITREQQIVGRIRVAAGEAGVSTGGSYGRLIDQAGYDAGRNIDILDTNFANQARAIQSGAQASNLQLSSQSPNALLTAFMGGLQGLSTGLSIANGVNAASPGTPTAGSSGVRVMPGARGDFPNINSGIA